MSNESKNNGLLLGTVIGCAVGVVSTLLLAPKSGAEMREDLSAKYQTVCNKTKDIVSSIGSASKEVASTLGEEGNELAKHAKQSVERIKESASQT